MEKQRRGLWATIIFAAFIVLGTVIHIQHKKVLRQTKIENTAEQINPSQTQMFSWNAPPEGYRSVPHIRAFEKGGSYFIWFYEDISPFPDSGFFFPITENEYMYLTVLREIVTDRATKLNLAGMLKEMAEGAVGMFIENTSGLCASRVVFGNSNPDYAGKSVCLGTVPTIELYIVLAHTRKPMPPIFAKESLFQKIEREPKFGSDI